MSYARRTLKILINSYDQLQYKCENPAFIVERTIQIGDMARKTNRTDFTDECYNFSFKMSKRNLPLCHHLVMVSLQRQMENRPKTPIDDAQSRSIHEQQMLPLLYNMLANINDDDNQQIADTMRQIGFQYAAYESHERARFYIERCFFIYRRLWPLENAAMKQCGAYLMKQEVFSDLLIPMKQTEFIDDLYFSASYEYQHPTDSEQAEEQRELWGM